MIKTFEQYNDLDPYNEENWEEYTVEDYWDLIKGQKQFFNKKIEKMGGIELIDKMKILVKKA